MSRNGFHWKKRNVRRLARSLGLRPHALHGCRSAVSRALSTATRSLPVRNYDNARDDDGRHRVTSRNLHGRLNATITRYHA